MMNSMAKHSDDISRPHGLYRIYFSFSLSKTQNENSTLTTPSATVIRGSTEPSDASHTTTLASGGETGTTTANDVTPNGTISPNPSATVNTRSDDSTRNNDESSDGITNASSATESAAAATTLANGTNADDSEVTTSNNVENNDEHNKV